MVAVRLSSAVMGPAAATSCQGYSGEIASKLFTEQICYSPSIAGEDPILSRDSVGHSPEVGVNAKC